VVTSVLNPDQIVSIKIDHEKCNMCEQCLNDNFCPHNLFYKDLVKVEKKEGMGIRYKYKEISKCQGCLKCELSCPEGAIEPVKYTA
jgi:ferredoxin